MLIQDLLNFGLLARDPFVYLQNLVLAIAIIGPALLIGIGIHEFSHALIANRLGDATAKRLGRLSLNPIVHLDPVGTLLLLVGGFGWGKPVPVNPYNLQGGMLRGMALVSVAGPVSNLVVATLAAMVFRFRLLDLYVAGSGFLPFGRMAVGEFLVLLVGTIISINLVLAVFNLIPIAPLDGFKVALWVLPREQASVLARTEQYGMGILVMLFAFDWMFNVGIFSRILSPIISGLFRMLVGPV